jgi:hypothetical protein
MTIASARSIVGDWAIEDRYYGRNVVWNSEAIEIQARRLSANSELHEQEDSVSEL